MKKKVQFFPSNNLSSIVVVGAQWGDEGKGKVIDFLSSQADGIVRGQGGNNAGHTVMVDDKEYKLHLIPSGVLHDKCECFLGGGMVIDLAVLVKEIEGLKDRGVDLKNRIWISPYANIIMPYHRIEDELSEIRKGKNSIGTTKSGIGPCYADKANRIGITISDFIEPKAFKEKLSRRWNLLDPQIIQRGSPTLTIENLLQEFSVYRDQISPLVPANFEYLVNQKIKQRGNILFEGAQGALLDNTFGQTQPYVTSSCTLAGGVCGGSGVGPTRIGHTLAIVKAYTTRVGNGPMPTETKEESEFINPRDHREVGTTTGRVRRVGWFDAVAVRTALMLNGADSLALTKLDVLDEFKTIKVCVKYKYRGKDYHIIDGRIKNWEEVTPIYEELPGWDQATSGYNDFNSLPSEAKRYIQVLETLCETKVSIVSVGPNRDQTILQEGHWPFKPQF